MQLLFSGEIPSNVIINADIVNGMLALSGIIFAFQPIIFRAKKPFFYRFLFLLIFLFEGLLMAYVSYDFVTDALTGSEFSGSTLEATAYSLFSNIAFLIYFVFADLIVALDE